MNLIEEYYEKANEEMIKAEDEKAFPKCPGCGSRAWALSCEADRRSPEFRFCECGYEFWHINTRYELLMRTLLNG